MKNKDNLKYELNGIFKGHAFLYKALSNIWGDLLNNRNTNFYYYFYFQIFGPINSC